MIRGTTRLIAHVGTPTAGFRSPQIYNPWFSRRGIDAAVVPIDIGRDAWRSLIRPLFLARNVIGALVTMPLKVATAALVDDLSPAARIAGACNAVRADAGGRLVGDMFDGEGFVRGLRRHGRDPLGAAALIVGSGGVGSAIAAALASAGAARLKLCDCDPAVAEGLAARLAQHYPGLAVTTGASDPGGCGIVVNATPLGAEDDDPLPLDPARLDPGCLVGDVVLRPQPTRLLLAARAHGCLTQDGDDMLFEQIPAYLAFFGLDSATAAELREVAEQG